MGEKIEHPREGAVWRKRAARDARFVKIMPGGSDLYVCMRTCSEDGDLIGSRTTHYLRSVFLRRFDFIHT